MAKGKGIAEVARPDFGRDAEGLDEVKIISKFHNKNFAVLPERMPGESDQLARHLSGLKILNWNFNFCFRRD